MASEGLSDIFVSTPQPAAHSPAKTPRHMDGSLDTLTPLQVATWRIMEPLVLRDPGMRPLAELVLQKELSATAVRSLTNLWLLPLSEVHRVLWWMKTLDAVLALLIMVSLPLIYDRRWVFNGWRWVRCWQLRCLFCSFWVWEATWWLVLECRCLYYIPSTSI